MFHLEKLKDLTCGHEYAVTVSNRFEVLNALQNQVELWDTFQHETLEAARGCVRWCLRSRGGFTSAETLDSIEKSHTARLAGNQDQYRTLSRRTRTLHSICTGVHYTLLLLSSFHLITQQSPLK